MTKRIVSIVLFVLSAVLIITSIAGFVIRGMDSTAAKLNEMRTSAVVHVASGGLVDGIASQANAAKLKELRNLLPLHGHGRGQGALRRGRGRCARGG